MVRPGLGWLLGVLAIAAPALAAAAEVREETVLLIADQVNVDTERNEVTAEGNVEVVRGERRLLADLLRYDRDRDQIAAEGNVILLEPTGEAIFADRVTLSGDLKNGVARQMRARLADDSLFAAAEGRRIDGNRKELDRAVYSPCPLCPDSSRPPLWQISAERVIHDEEGQNIIYRNAFFELFGVPIAYTPYLSHPDPTVERRSGFLAPSFGNDSELGLLLQTPYYFALAPNYDLTLSPIFTSEENAVLTAEYRHLVRSGRFELAASGTYATEAVGDPNKQPKGNDFRGHIEGDGRFRLRDGARWGYDLAVTSDDTYLQRYGFSEDNVLTNRLFADQVWDRNYAAINAYGFQGLRRTDDQGLIPIALPLAEVDLTSAPWRWGSRFTLESSLLALTRTDGLDTRRLSTTGGFELPWSSALGDLYRLRLSLRGDVYHTDGNPVTLDDEGGTDVVVRGIPRATLDWSWPWIGETFGLTPVLEPTASVTWTVDDPNDEDIPNEDSRDLEFDDSNLFEPSRFAGIDVVEGGSRISYGLRFGAFGDDGELVSGLFGQSFRFSGDQEFTANTGIDDDLSDYVGRIDVTPDPSFRVRYRFRLDRDSLSLLRNEIGAVVGPRRVRFDVTYLSLDDDPEAGQERSREEITAGVTVGLLRSLSLRAQTRRNLRADRTVWHKFGLIYRHPCLQLVAGLERRFTQNRDAEDTTTFSFRVIFQNLGELAADSKLLGQ